MSKLVALVFEDETTAFDVRNALLKMQKQYLIELEDSVVVTRNQNGKVKLDQAMSLTAAGAIGGDTENYANAHGAISATLESGSHFDKRSNDIAYRSVLSFLTLLKMLPGEVRAQAPLEIVDVYSVILKEADDFHYSGVVDNFRPIAKGETFAIQGGRNLKVDEDSYLLIPMKPEETRIGEEVCYLGRRIDAPASA